MKKTFVVLYILSGMNNSMAQVFEGIQAGLNISSISSVNLKSVTSKTGYHAGVLINFPFTGDHFSIMLSALYSTKGFKYIYSNSVNSVLPDTSGGSVTSTVNVLRIVDATLCYLDIPVLLTFFASDNKGVFFQAGPQVSFLISDKSFATTIATISQNGSPPKPATLPGENSIHFNSSDLSAVGGIGFKLPHYLLFYARVSSGLVEVEKNRFLKYSAGEFNLVYQAGIALTIQ